MTEFWPGDDSIEIVGVETYTWLDGHPGVRFVLAYGKPSWRNPVKRLRWMFGAKADPPWWSPDCADEHGDACEGVHE